MGIFAHSSQPTKGSYKSWAYLPKSCGSLLFSSTANSSLAPGKYDAWFLFDDGYTPLAGPVTINI